MFLSSEHSRNTNDPPASLADVSIKPLRYSLFKWFLDRRSASRDGRNGLPVYSVQPAATPTIRRLVAEFTGQAAAERELRERATAFAEQRLADLTSDIQAALTAGKQQPGGAQQTAANGVWDADLNAWRQKRTHEQLADWQAEQKRVEKYIASQHKQYLDRRNQLAAHTWRRIETYWGKLIQVHPDGELLSEVINEWGSGQLGDPLRRLVELDEQMIESDQFRHAIEPSEGE